MTTEDNKEYIELYNADDDDKEHESKTLKMSTRGRYATEDNEEVIGVCY